MQHIDSNRVKSSINKFILIATCIAVLAPFIYLAFFNSPSSDDYADYILVRDNGLFKSVLDYYTGWSGRCTSVTLVFLINPLQGGPWFWIFLTLIQLAMYSLLWYLLTVLFERIMGLKFGRLPAFTILLVYGFCYLQRSVEVLYWFTGSWAYLPGLIGIAGWACVRYSLKPISAFHKSLLVILPFFIAGTNELCICLMGTVLLLPGKPSISMKLRFLIASGFIPGLALALLSPGNSVRSAYFELEQLLPVHDFAFSIKHTFRVVWFFLRDWLRSTPLIPVAMLLGFMSNEIINVKKVIFQVINLIAGGSVILAMPFVFFWATGSYTPPDRLLDVLFICISVLVIFSVSRLIQLIKHSTSLSFGLVTVCALLLLFNASYDSKLRVALNDIELIDEYAKDLRMRRNLTENCAKNNPQDTLYLPPVRNIPNTIFFSEFSHNYRHWYNKAYAEYFNVKAVVLLPDKKEKYRN